MAAAWIEPTPLTNSRISCADRANHIQSARLANSYPPVFRLPPETLYLIFLFVQAPGGAQRAHRPSGLPPSLVDWIDVTYVCRLWRQVALLYARLWERVSFPASTPWITELLLRSRGAPIILDYTFAHSTRPYSKQHFAEPRLFRKTLSENLFRTKELYLSRSFPRSPVDFTTLTASAPRLEVFKWELDFLLEPEDQQLPDLFAHDAPRLQSLTLHRVGNFIWDSPILLKLRHLEIVAKLRGFARPAPGQLFATLQKLTKLESLVLHDCLPSIPLTPSDLITLPHLTYLELRDDNLRCTGFMRHLTAPAGDIRVNLLCFVMATDDMALPIQTFTSHFYHNPTRIRTIHFASTDDRRISVKTWREPIPAPRAHEIMRRATVSTGRSHPLSAPDFSLTFETKSSRNLNALRHAICDALPLDDLSVLFIEGRKTYWKQSTWSEVLRRATQLQRIHIQDYFSLTALGAAMADSLIGDGKQGHAGFVNPVRLHAWPELTSRLRDRRVGDGASDREVLYPNLVSIEHSWDLSPEESALFSVLAAARTQEGRPLVIRRLAAERREKQGSG